MSARRGKTLIELMVVISIMAAVTTLGARLMVLLMRTSNHSTQTLNATTTTIRLSREFRRDVHAAIDVALEGSDNEAPSRLLLTLPEEKTVDYVLAGEKLQRTTRQGKKRIRSEQFQLSDSDNHFEWNANDRLVSFIHVRKPTKATNKTTTPPPSEEMRVEAVLGRDRRFTVQTK